MRLVRTVLVGLLLATCCAPTRAEETEPTEDALREAIRRAIPLLEKGSRGSADARECFTCHNQAVPAFALIAARRHGFPVDQENLDRQLKHTADHLVRGREAYREGRGQGGQVLTAGYALWTLNEGGWQHDETTEAVASYLVAYQKDSVHWRHRGKRPPSSGSDFTATYVALRGLADFGTAALQPQIRERTESIKPWLVTEKPQDTEDRVFRLRSLALVDAAEEDLVKARDELLVSQRDDGGWAQKDGMESDAYATATVLVTLLQTGTGRDHLAVQKGLRYLLETQLEDGSWHVVTHAEPIQTYFESGFPHGTDQFISMAASGWSTLAMLLALPET